MYSRVLIMWSHVVDTVGYYRYCTSNPVINRETDNMHSMYLYYLRVQKHSLREAQLITEDNIMPTCPNFQRPHGLA